MQSKRARDIVLSRRALIAFNTLAPTSRKKVKNAIKLLQGFPDDSYAERSVKELAGSPDLFVLRATNTLRIIFSYSGSTKTILDIVRSDRLRKMYGDLD